jgi:LmbE family N-acetylglucosaminyl deacetylase
MEKLFKELCFKLSAKWFRYLAIAIVSILAVSLLFYFLEVPPVMAQSMVSKLGFLSVATAGQKVLFFSPHADDESIAAGGYIAQSVINGADVTIVMVTNSNAQGIEATRYAEFKKATSILGVPEANLVFLGFPDGELDSINKAELQAALQQQIDKYNPDIIVYPSPHDYNSDHRTIGKAMEMILKTESTPIAAYSYLVHYELDYPKPRKLAPADYIMPPEHLAKAEKEWLSFDLSSSVESCKEKAIYTYQSQIHDLELNGLMHGNIRKNEIFAISKLNN